MDETRFLASIEYWQIGVGLIVAVGVLVSMLTRTVSSKFDKVAAQILDRMDKQEGRLESHITGLAETHIRIIDRIARIEGQMNVQNMRSCWIEDHHKHRESEG